MPDEIVPEKSVERSLEVIADETVGRYQELFTAEMLADVIQQSSNAANTKRLADLFERALPENSAERQSILDMCVRRDPAVAYLEGAFTAYQSEQELAG